MNANERQAAEKRLMAKGLEVTEAGLEAALKAIRWEAWDREHGAEVTARLQRRMARAQWTMVVP